MNVSTGLDQRFPRNFVADVTVHFRDGTLQHMFTDRAKGMPAQPFTAQEHQDKLNELTRDVFGVDRASRLFALIDTAAGGTPVSVVAALLRTNKTA